MRAPSRFASWVLFVVTNLLVATGCAPKVGTIGCVLKQTDSGHLVVVDVPKDLGAARAGVRVGDEILLIEGQDVRTMKPERVHEVLSGEEGKPVRLTLVRGGEVLRVSVVRTPRVRYPRQGGSETP